MCAWLAAKLKRVLLCAQVFIAGTVNSLVEFQSTPSLLNGGLEITAAYYPGARHYGVIYGRYDPITLDQQSFWFVRTGILLAIGTNAFPIGMVINPPLPAPNPRANSGRRLSGSSVSWQGDSDAQDEQLDATVTSEDEVLPILPSTESQQWLNPPSRLSPTFWAAVTQYAHTAYNFVQNAFG